MLTLATTPERRHKIARQLSHELMGVLSSASDTHAGISQDLDASGVAQRMRDDRLPRYQAFRSRHQPKSTNQEIEVKIPGDLYAANPRRNEVLVNSDVFSTLRRTSIRVGDRMVDQAPESIEPSRTSRQAQRLAGSASLCYPAHGRHKLFQERSQWASFAER